MLDSITLVETRIKQVEDRLADFKKQEAARKAELKQEDHAVIGIPLLCNNLDRSEPEDKRRDSAGPDPESPGEVLAESV